MNMMSAAVSVTGDGAAPNAAGCIGGTLIGEGEQS
jgi:hypothetical protein